MTVGNTDKIETADARETRTWVADIEGTGANKSSGPNLGSLLARFIAANQRLTKPTEDRLPVQAPPTSHSTSIRSRTG
jgi:hypothetical protein